MTDTMTPEQRRRCMSHIRAKDTKPEMVVRRFLWAHGYRYRLHSSKLPGHPDIVLSRLKTVVFVNGCFWHGHNVTEVDGGELENSACCKIPHTNRQFWLNKINRNRERDVATAAKIKAMGWRVIVLWECELKPKRREATLNRLLNTLQPIKPYMYEESETYQAAEDESIYGSRP